MALAAELGEHRSRSISTQLNPGVNRWATDPDGPHRLLVPEPAAAAFDGRRSRTLGERERVELDAASDSSSGETLSRSPASIRTTRGGAASGQRLRGNLIRAGDYLMIPHAAKSLDALQPERADARGAAEHPRDRCARAQLSTSCRPANRSGRSRAPYDVSVRELASWNAMAPGDVLSVGRKLVIWSDNPAAAPRRCSPARPSPRRTRFEDQLHGAARRFACRRSRRAFGYARRAHRMELPLGGSICSPDSVSSCTWT